MTLNERARLRHYFIFCILTLVENCYAENSTEALKTVENDDSLNRLDYTLLCDNGIPLLQENDRPKMCIPYSQNKEYTCPRNFWCHIGSSNATNYCCPKNKSVTNPCQLPLANGYGSGKMRRFWYDWRSSTCRELTYTGYGGNENNFVTALECERACSETPQSTEIPVVYVQVDTLSPQPSNINNTINSVRGDKLPAETKVAHVKKFTEAPTRIPTTVTEFTTEDIKNPCEFSPDKGYSVSEVKSSLRWYYDVAAAHCVQFNYLGNGGNTNNFETDHACMDACGSGKHEISSCLYPLSKGSGSFAIPRYYYDAKQKSCIEFIYTGRGGNGNRFITKQECVAVCIEPPRKPKKAKITTTASPEIQLSITSLIPQVLKKIGALSSSTVIELGSTPALPQEASTTRHTTASQTTQQTVEPTKTIQVTTEITTVTPRTVTEFPVTASWEYPTLVSGFTEGFSFITSSVPNRNSQTMTAPEGNSTFYFRPDMFQSLANVAKSIYTPVQNPATKFSSFVNHSSQLSPPSSLGNTGGSDLVNNLIFPPSLPNSNIQVIPPFVVPRNLGSIDAGSGLQLSPCLQPLPSGSYTTDCAFAEKSVCGPGMFCQIGPQQSVCCPNLSDNPCIQPQEPGFGTGSLGRWYYDAASRQCKTFAFNGFRGNQNNFVTFRLCQQACGAVNPCQRGDPLMQNNVHQRCTPNDSSSCASGYYCQIIDNTFDSVCCPLEGTMVSNKVPAAGNVVSTFGNREVSPCFMTIEFGNGDQALHRWAYNPTKQTCETFVYSGRNGNQNNFLTKSDCMQTCIASENPCGSGRAVTNGNSFVRCNSFGQSICPSTHYCHIGSTDDTTVCCPLSGVNRCLLPPVTGAGSAVLHRYYFDSDSSTCKPFTYTGVGGNENNFMSIKDCRVACPEYDNPCPTGTPLVNQIDGSVSFCSAINPNCSPGYWCHIGDTRQTSVCCPGGNVGYSERASGSAKFRRPSMNPSLNSRVHPASKCTLPVKTGSGYSQLPRFFYNVKTRACEQFLYSGKGGNQNNFVTKWECEDTCPVLDNPCSGGFPAMDTDETPVLCSTAAPNVCPTGYFCHIGATAATTLCCPGEGNPCYMPMARGNGNSVLNRWYFNQESQVCVSFVYTGRNGNQNNFISRQDCLTACPEYRSPCPEGQPHIGLSGQITHCGATGPTICPTTYWCHIGATLDTSVCCPGATDPCDQELQLGTGSAQLLRFYYNQLTRTCHQFQYTGLGGNENNFLTLEACESRCPVFVNPCAFGQPQLDESHNPVGCSAADETVCSDNYFCHIGDSEQTTVCCPGKSEDICREPRVPGTGAASLNRFVYNAFTRQCLPFVYTGIGGNQNNFLSKAACETTCPVLLNPCAGGDPATGANGQYIMCSSTAPNVCPAGYWCHIGEDVTASLCCPGNENPCTLPPSKGSGSGHLSRWYYDVNLRRCMRFTYTGYGGNQNNFITLQECQIRCPEFQNPCATGDPAQAPSGGILFCSLERQTCPSSYWCHIGSSADNTVCCPSLGDPCLSAMSPGTGSAKLPRWYFNQNTRQCLQFTYTGSGGNENNFNSEASCATKCPVFRNPCPNILISNLLTVTKCSAQNPYSCPAGHWCHIGGTSETSVCCPGASDPCRLPIAQGVTSGMGPFTRWYYDLDSKICKPFQYTGMGGNENNFLTREDCVTKCPEFINPCYTGDPYRELETGLIRFCDSNSAADCPKNYYCHVGENAQTTVCCPGFTDPCSSPLSIGSGSANLPRWYFNSRSKKCQQFTYTGVGGNSNNFLSQTQCVQSCPEFSNPCANGSPLTAVGGGLTYCSPHNPNICPQGYFCHVGSTQDSTVCCPGSVNPCQLPLDVGRGAASLPRFYFNQLSRKCQQFSYSGQGGNANNFVNIDSCRRSCPEYNNPCQMGEPLQLIGGGSFYCSATTPCPSNYFCHIGDSISTTVCCPSPIQASPCVLPVVIGTGQAQLNRFYYNAALQLCVPFVYSGLGGNQNNFVNLQDCADECLPFKVSNLPSAALGSPPCQGPECTQAKPKARHKAHSPVKPRLCPQGEPLMTAHGVPVSCSIKQANACPHNGYVCSAMANGDAFCCPDPRNFCLLPRNPGNCQPSDSIPNKFGYNPISDSCVQFKFTGCGGNLNNFNSISECSNICCNKGYNLLFHDSSASDDTPDDGNITKKKKIGKNRLSVISGLDNETLIPLDDDSTIFLPEADKKSLKVTRIAKRGGWFSSLKFW